MRTTAITLTCGLAALMGTSYARPAAKPAPVVKPAPAAQLLASAQTRAAKEHKAVLVVFHASWCGWCKRLESVMDKPEYKKLFADNYIVVPLDVSEQGEQKTLENPGADKIMADLGGAKSGLPFYAVLSSRGKQLANSNALPGANGEMENIGYPAAPKEIAAFDGLLKKTAPSMNATARQSLIAYFTQASPQRANNGDAAH